MTDLVFARLLFTAILGAVGFFLQPFGLTAPLATATGILVAGFIVFLEIRLKRATLQRLIGAGLGAVAGILSAYLISLVIAHGVSGTSNTIQFIQIGILGLCTYIGVVVGASKGDMLNLAALGGLVIFDGEEFRPGAVHGEAWGSMIALRGTDIIRVPLAEATRALKLVPPERYAEAEVFFG